MFTQTFMRLHNVAKCHHNAASNHGQRLAFLREFQAHVQSVPEVAQTPILWLLSMSHEVKHREPLPLSAFQAPDWSALFSMVLQHDAAAVLIAIPHAAHDVLSESLPAFATALATLNVGIVDVLELEEESWTSWRAAHLL